MSPLLGNSSPLRLSLFRSWWCLSSAVTWARDLKVSMRIHPAAPAVGGYVLLFCLSPKLPLHCFVFPPHCIQRSEKGPAPAHPGPTRPTPMYTHALPEETSSDTRYRRNLEGPLAPRLTGVCYVETIEVFNPTFQTYPLFLLLHI